MLKYCARCVMPHTKPHLQFSDDGVCDACRLYEERGEINWDARKKNLKASWTRIAVKTEVIGIAWFQ